MVCDFCQLKEPAAANISKILIVCALPVDAFSRAQRGPHNPES